MNYVTVRAKLRVRSRHCLVRAKWPPVRVTVIWPTTTFLLALKLFEAGDHSIVLSC